MAALQVRPVAAQAARRGCLLALVVSVTGLPLVVGAGMPPQPPIHLRLPPDVKRVDHGEPTASWYINHHPAPRVRTITPEVRSEIRRLFLSAFDYDLNHFHQTFMIDRAAPLYQLLYRAYPAVDWLPFAPPGYTDMADIQYALRRNLTREQIIAWEKRRNAISIEESMPPHVRGFRFPARAWTDPKMYALTSGKDVGTYMDTYPVTDTHRRLDATQRRRLVQFWGDALALSLRKYSVPGDVLSTSPLFRLTQTNFPSLAALPRNADLVDLAAVVRAIKADAADSRLQALRRVKERRRRSAVGRNVVIGLCVLLAVAALARLARRSGAAQTCP